MDVRRFVNLPEELWDASIGEQAALAPDDQELVAEVLRLQIRQSATAGASSSSGSNTPRSSLTVPSPAPSSTVPASPRTALAPALRDALEADLVHKRALLVGITEAAATRRRQRLRLNLADAPPTPRPTPKHLRPLALNGTDWAAPTAIVLLMDGLHLGWADRRLGDLERSVARRARRGGVGKRDTPWRPRTG